MKYSSAGSAMAASLSRQREWPTNAQLFLIGKSAPMADLHSGACTSLNPWPCQTQSWGKVEGMREKNKREKRLGLKRGKKKERKKRLFFLIFCFVLLDGADIGLTRCECMFNDRLCQRARALCVCKCFHSTKVQLCTPNMEKNGGKKQLIKTS